MRPILFIGLGGTGGHIISRILTALSGDPSTAGRIGDALQFLHIDTAIADTEDLSLPKQYVRNLGFNTLPYIKDACRNDRDLQRWFDCRVLDVFPPAQFDLSLSQGKTRYRQLGRLSLYADLARGPNWSKLITSIQRALGSTIFLHSNMPPLVLVCTSLIGGTGGAMALDIAYLVRHISAIMHRDSILLGVFALSNIFSKVLNYGSTEPRTTFILNEVAALKEMQYFARAKYAFGPQQSSIEFSNVEPFDAYWLFGSDKSVLEEELWPTDFFDSMAIETASNEILSGHWPYDHRWLMYGSIEAFVHAQDTSYIEIPAPLVTSVLTDWTYWEGVYKEHIKDSSRLSPHISREFDRWGG